MRRQIITIIALFAVMLLAGAASAYKEVTLSNSSNSLLQGVVVKAIYDDTNGLINVYYDGPGTSGITNTVKGISEIGIVLDDKAQSFSVGFSPSITNNQNIDGFGKFTWDYQQPDGTAGTSSSSPITLSNFVSTFTVPPLPNNDNSASTVVHLYFYAASGLSCSGFISDGTPNGISGDTSGCTTTNKIPEFPSVAIPIAAVLGLVFFFQQTKKKEE